MRRFGHAHASYPGIPFPPRGFKHNIGKRGKNRGTATCPRDTKIGPQCALGVLCFMLVCFYSFRLEFCFQMSVSGSLTAASEKVDK